MEREREKRKGIKDPHLCVDLHTTLRLEDLDFLSAAGPVGLELNLELGRKHTEHLHQCRLSGVQSLALLAHGVAVLSLDQVECDLTLNKTGGNTELAESGLDGVADRLVLVGGDLTTTGGDKAVGKAERAGGFGSSASEILGAESLEVLDDSFGCAGGEQQTDGAGEVGSELVHVGRGFTLGVLAKGLGHDLGLSKEHTVRELGQH